MRIVKRCNFCKNKNLKFLFYGKDKSFHIPGKFPILKCGSCGLICLGVAPNPKELDKYYPEEYYSFEQIQTKEKSRKTRIKIFLYDLHFNPKNRKDILKILFLPVAPFVRGTVISSDKKLLDVGSGSGQFLYEMKQFGMIVQGVEPGNFDRESSKEQGINIRNTDLLSARYSKEHFDIITINHVLEHVPEPAKIIKEMYRILKKDGKLIVGVPNYRSLAYSLFGKNWYQLDVPRHLNDFSDKILIKKLRGEGFKIKKVRHNARPTQFTVSLFYSMNIDHKKHPLMVNVLNLFFLPLTYFVNFFKIGDQIEVYCSK